MKKTALCLMLACCSYFLLAQAIKPDSTYGVNGVVETDLHDPNLNPYGINIVIFSDGKVVTLGETLQDRLMVKKYKNDGTIEGGFSTLLEDFSPYRFGASSQQDGKIIISAPKVSDQFQTAVARLNIEGGIDASFGNGGTASVYLNHAYESNLLALTNGKIVVFGSERLNMDNNPSVVTRLFADGSMDSTFGTNGTFRYNTILGPEFIPAGVEQPDGKLLFAGMAAYRLLLLRLNPDGSLDSSFSDDGFLIDSLTDGGEAYCLNLQADGKIVVGGYTLPAYHAITARYHTNGDRDSTFGNAGVHYFSDPEIYGEGVGIAVLPNGKIIMLIADLDESRIYLTQLLPNGQRDPSFGNNGIYQYPETNLRPRSMVLSSNKLIISGREADTDNVFLLRVLLDLSVGTLNPNTTATPNLWVYPNPVAEPFTLKFGLSQKEQVSIYLFDMSRKQGQSFVQNQSFEQGEHELSLSCAEHLTAGNYVLTLEVAGKKMSSIQIMKK